MNVLKFRYESVSIIGVLIIYVCILPLLASCARHNAEAMPCDVSIVRLDSIVRNVDTEEVGVLDNEYGKVLDRLRYLMTGDTLLSTDEFVRGYASSQAVRVFGPDVRRILPDLSEEERQIGIAFGHLAAMDSTLFLPDNIYGVVTPYSQSVMLIDSIIFVGLNHYLGADYVGYEGFENYKRIRKVPQRMAYDVVEALVRSRYPYEVPYDKATALSRMQYEGAILYVMKHCFPGITYQELLGYSDSEMTWAEDNERRIWQELAGRELLYSTDPSVSAKLVNPSANTNIINPSAPGMTGRYVGYRIVEKYVENHPEIHLTELLRPAFYSSAETLKNSGYRP